MASAARGLEQRLRQARTEAFFSSHTRGEPALPRQDLDDLIARTAMIYSQALTDQTRATYLRRWRKFETWAAEQGLDALPASGEAVMMYLTDSAEGEGCSLSTLRGRVAAINRVHVEAGFQPPGDDPGMAMLMRGLGRTLPYRRTGPPIAALRIADLRDVCRQIPTVDLTSARDRALFALLGCSLSYATLSYLRWGDIAFDGQYIDLALRVTPSRLEGRRRLWSGDHTGPGPALSAWHAMAGRRPRLVFTRVEESGRRSTRCLFANGIRRIVESRLDSLGLPATPEGYSKAERLLTGPASIDLRDRALLLIGFAGALRRNEVTNLRWADIRPTPEGLILRLRRSKTDPAGRGQDVGIPHGHAELTCPVRAIGAWRARVEEQLGDAYNEELPCFPKIGRAGRIGSQPISPEALTRVVKVRAADAQLPGRWGGRSLRAGFVTTAAELDIPLEAIARQSRHASLDNLVRYIRVDDPFRRNPVDRVGM